MLSQAGLSAFLLYSASWSPPWDVAYVFERLISKFHVKHTSSNLPFPWSVGEHSHLVLITLAFPISRLAYKSLLNEVNPGGGGEPQSSPCWTWKFSLHSTETLLP